MGRWTRIGRMSVAFLGLVGVGRKYLFDIASVRDILVH